MGIVLHAAQYVQSRSSCRLNLCLWHVVPEHGSRKHREMALHHLVAGLLEYATNEQGSKSVTKVPKEEWKGCPGPHHLADVRAGEGVSHAVQSVKLRR